MSSEFSYKQNVISNTFENGIRTNYFKYTFISWWMLTSFPLYRSIFLLVMSNTCLSTLSSVQFIIKHLDLYQYVVKKKKSQCSFNLHFFEWGWTAFHILKICFHEHRWYSFPITRISDFCDSFSFYDSFLVFVYIYIFVNLWSIQFIPIESVIYGSIFLQMAILLSWLHLVNHQCLLIWNPTFIMY